MTEVEPRARERIVEVSSQTLGRICPEAGGRDAPRGTSLVRRWAMACRVRFRLLWTRARFRYDDFRALRCLSARWRLRARLAWMRLRHRGRLSR